MLSGIKKFIYNFWCRIVRDKSYREFVFVPILFTIGQLYLYHKDYSCELGKPLKTALVFLGYGIMVVLSYLKYKYISK